jgi:predicted transcriptional regulator
MNSTRIFPVRMDNETIKTLKTLAIYQDQSVSKIIRDMVLAFIASQSSSNTSHKL